MLVDDVALVLEGGGFRGSYTSGAMQWLADHDIFFKDTYAISACAPLSFYYLSDQNDIAHKMAVHGFTDKKILGLPAIFSEGTLVAYEYMLETYMLPYYKKGLDALEKSGRTLHVGLFSTTNDRLEYFTNKEFDEKGQLLKSSCVLPVTGKQTGYNGEKFLDGGIDTMVPVAKAESDGYKKQLVIVTKHYGYQRKPNGFWLSALLHLVYRKYKNMLYLLDHRVDQYNNQMGAAQKLQDEGLGALIRPSKDSGVGRFSGTAEQLEESFQLGYSDMESRKEEIFHLLGIEK